jgi:membrane peptidoglycan carboxypeptidase
MGMAQPFSHGIAALLRGKRVTAELDRPFEPGVGRRLILTLALAAALGGPVLATLWVWTPSGDDVQARVESVAASRGTTVLKPEQVPKRLAQAIVAIEDERFYEHHGIDSIGLGRAVLYDVTNACLCQGGSTITQQLVKDLYLGGSDRGYDKLEDMVLALKVERLLSKDEILADYLSEITTGYGRYGVVAAACAYFGRPLANLTLAQYALLAGVTQAPSVYDPTINPDLARQRRAQVLAQMVAERYVTAAQADAANSEPVTSSGPGC